MTVAHSRPGRCTASKVYLQALRAAEMAAWIEPVASVKPGVQQERPVETFGSLQAWGELQSGELRLHWLLALLAGLGLAYRLLANAGMF